LDTARFRYLLSEHVKVDARNVHAYIIGEHGDTEVAAWSLANIAEFPWIATVTNAISARSRFPE